MVCFNSRDFAGIREPIEFLAASHNMSAVSAFRALRKQIGKSGEMCRCKSMSRWKFGQ